MGGEVVKETEQNPVMRAGGGVEVRGGGVGNLNFDLE